MKVTVDYDVCASTGSCMQVCPEVFEVRSDGYLYVLQEEPPEELRTEGRGGRRPLPDRRHHRRGLTGSMGFHARLAKAWATSGSMLCVGLDPDPAAFPAPLDGVPDAIERFCTAIVDATADLVCAFKPQFAHFAAAARRAGAGGGVPLHPRALPGRRRSCSTPSAATSARPPSTTPGRRSAATPPTP